MTGFTDKKELPFFLIDGAYGFDQERFPDPWMKLGGCGAVTACDSCIYFDLYKHVHMYPYTLSGTTLTKADYVRFSKVMKPFLRPRHMGINTLEIYMDGFEAYQREILGGLQVRMRGFSGKETVEKAREMVRQQIDLGYPIPCLVLRHKDPRFEDFVWHWFLLTGYQRYREEFLVKAVSYGEWKWFDLDILWDTGYEERGGLVLFEV